MNVCRASEKMPPPNGDCRFSREHLESPPPDAEEVGERSETGGGGDKARGFRCAKACRNLECHGSSRSTDVPSPRPAGGPLRVGRGRIEGRVKVGTLAAYEQCIRNKGSEQ